MSTVQRAAADFVGGMLCQDPDDCAPVLQVVLSAPCIAANHATRPYHSCCWSGQHARHAQSSSLALQVWLQTFAWSERGLQRKLAAREANTAHCGSLRHAPMFCVETAIRMFHWSASVYKSDEQVHHGMQWQVNGTSKLTVSRQVDGTSSEAPADVSAGSAHRADRVDVVRWES